MYCAVLVVAAVAGVTGAGFWLTSQPARTRRRVDGWAFALELACYVTGILWVVFGIASVYAFFGLGAIGLGWVVVGFAAGRGVRVAAGLACAAGSLFCLGSLLAIGRGATDGSPSTPAWAWIAAGVWYLSSAGAALAGGIVAFRRRSRA